MARIVVLGSGVAGASAALAACGDEREVIVVDGGSGASTLASGALDGDGDGDLRLPFAGFALGACSVATTAGIVRKARGRDLALLDVGAVREGVIAVPTSAHHGWDARILAAQWNDRSEGDGAPARRFVPLDATLLRFADERDLPDVDLARRHDDPARLGWLAERLREALARAQPGGEAIRALILPPWLGAVAPRALALTAMLRLPAGEALATTLGPSGLRFEAARDVAYAAHAITVRRARAEALSRAAGGFVLQLDTGESLSAGAVVLALGGWIGGGLRYTPSGSDLGFAVPARGRATVELALHVDPTLAPSLPLGLAGRPLLAPGSLFGASPEQLAWPFVQPAPLERVGVLAAEGAHDLFVAGELAADLPRTWLAAVTSGQRAGRAAAAAVTSR